jgi:hypothetical protein
MTQQGRLEDGASGYRTTPGYRVRVVSATKGFLHPLMSLEPPIDVSCDWTLRKTSLIGCAESQELAGLLPQKPQRRQSPPARPQSSARERRRGSLRWNRQKPSWPARTKHNPSAPKNRLAAANLRVSHDPVSAVHRRISFQSLCGPSTGHHNIGMSPPYLRIMVDLAVWAGTIELAGVVLTIAGSPSESRGFCFLGRSANADQNMGKRLA